MREMQTVRDRADRVREKGAQVFKGRDADEFVSFMRETYAELDACIRELYAEYPPPRETACVKGCWYCCHSRVSASAPEVVYLAMGVQNWWSDESRAWVDEQCARRMSLGNSHAEVWRAAVVCPLLASGECMAYGLRPAACRGCNSLDGETCKQAFFKGEAETIVSRYAPQARASEYYRAALMDAAASQGLYAACRPHTTLLTEFMRWDNPGRDWLEGRVPDLA